MNKVEVHIDPSRKVKNLSYIEQQMVEIARIFFIEKSEIIILDEPTSPLAAHEVEILFNYVRSMRDRGVSFIYISHYLDEIFRICDRVIILRDGVIVVRKRGRIHHYR